MLEKKIAYIYEIYDKENVDSKTFKLDILNIAEIITNKNGTFIKETPKYFGKKYNIEEFEEYEYMKGKMIYIDTPIFIEEEDIEYLKKVINRMNKNKQVCILDQLERIGEIK